MRSMMLRLQEPVAIGMFEAVGSEWTRMETYEHVICTDRESSRYGRWCLASDTSPAGQVGAASSSVIVRNGQVKVLELSLIHI